MTKTVLGVCAAAAMALASNIEITGFDYPESVLVDGNRVAVSNVGKQPLPMEKDGDGYISLLNTDGKILEKEFVKGLHSPKGMAFVRHGLGGTLYVADVNEIKGFNSNSKKEVFSLAIEGAMFLNDIAKKDDKTLYVSGSDSGKIYEVDTASKKYKVVAQLPAANGLLYDGKKLYAVSLGKSAENMFGGGGGLFEVDTVSGNVTKLAKAEGMLDGLQKFGDTLYFSDWVKMGKEGVIWTYNLKTKEEGVLAIDKIAGPADFWIDKKGRFWVPNMLEGKVSVIEAKQ